MARTSAFLVAVLTQLCSTSALAQAGEEWSSPFPVRPSSAPVSPPPALAPQAPAPTPTPAPTLAPPSTPAAAPAPAPTPALDGGASPGATTSPSALDGGAAPSASTSPRALDRAGATGAAGRSAPADGGTAFGGTAVSGSPDGGLLALPVAARLERFEPGTEPHSPATRANPLLDAANTRVALGKLGLGGLSVPSARLGRGGIARVGFTAEWFDATDFPVLGARNLRSAITFAASYQPVDWAEVSLTYGAAANTSSRTAPRLIQTLGDVTVGFKASRAWLRGLWAGGDLRVLSFSAVGNQGADRIALGVRPLLVATADVREWLPVVPLVASVAAGFTVDGTGALVSQRLTAAEEFALAVHRYPRFDLGLLFEVPLPWTTPFVEYRLAAPLGVPNGVLVGPDGSSVSPGAAMPHVLGLGAKLTAIKDLTLTLAFDLGLSSAVGLGVPATAPWNLHAGASFAIDPWQRGDSRVLETVRLKTVERPREATFRVTGTVTDGKSTKPVPGAVVHSDQTRPVATDAQGRFETLEHRGPSARLSVTHPGYRSFEGVIAAGSDGGAPPTADIVLVPEDEKATLELSATADGRPVKATVSVKGAVSERAVELTEADTAPRPVEVAPGTFTVQVDAAGYLSQTRDVQISVGGRMAVPFKLMPAPKQALVVFKGEKIEILQQVHFATGKATILPDSAPLLAEVIDSIIKNGVKRVRVEGHTDNRGPRDFNLKLSEDRARSVANALIASGIDAARLGSAGFGDSRPIAPNLTAKGREKNRRVEFIVLER